MSKITASGIFKVIDIEHSQLMEETKKYFHNEAGETYKDQVLKEHLYSIENVLDQYTDEEKDSSEVLEELDKIKKLCDHKKASYFRIVYN